MRVFYLGQNLPPPPGNDCLESGKPCSSLPPPSCCPQLPVTSFFVLCFEGNDASDVQTDTRCSSPGRSHALVSFAGQHAGRGFYHFPCSYLFIYLLRSSTRRRGVPPRILFTTFWSSAGFILIAEYISRHLPFAGEELRRLRRERDIHV